MLPANPAPAKNELRAAIDDGTLFTESFGDRHDPPVLLMMGAMASGVWWPGSFCSQLASRGRFVLRYDHRDTGRSTSYGPGAATYFTETLADDALSVLDAYNIQSAHLVGMSLGGYLGQLLALKAPQRVKTITLFASECLAPKDPSIPAMDPRLLEYHARAAKLDWADREAVLDYQVGAWRLLTGSGHPFDEEYIRGLAAEDWERTPNPLTPFNHAVLKEPTGWLGRLDEVQAPALIIHGTEDLVVPYAHALASHSALRDSRLLTLRGTGHEIHPLDWPLILDAIVEHTGRV
ncbi:MAG TPA: alpha/beta fold hydrolase [Terracidiphilus sp.]|nr:alpha/beta fold hydrolase [Terracidiphilus sp.]